MKASDPLYHVVADLARLQKVKMTEPERCKAVLKRTARHYALTNKQLIELIIEQFKEWE